MDDIDVGTILIWLVCGTIGLALLIYLLSCIKILKEYERAVIFRLGRVRPERGPGIILVMPFIERAKANQVLAQSVTPELLKLKAIEKWTGQVPQYSGGSSPVPFISLDK